MFRFRPQTKDILFAVVEEQRNQNIFVFKMQLKKFTPDQNNLH